MPDAAHSHGGVATLNAGSSTTTLGASRGSTMACFTRVPSSVMPATAVNSPAESVVGTATCGSPRPACGAEVSSRRCTAALAASMGLPPPKLTTQSARYVSSASARPATAAAGTCWRAPVNTWTQRAPSAPVTCARSGEAPRVRPVTTTARDAPSRSTSSPRCATLPAPNTTRSRCVSGYSPLRGSMRRIVLQSL